MKKINVIVKDKTTLELTEDACIGDIIDLEDLVQVDTSYIDSIIDSGKDKVYESKIAELKKIMNAEKEIEINNIKSEIALLKQENTSDLKIKEQEVSKNYELQILNLQKQIQAISESKKNELEVQNNKKEIEINQLKAAEKEKFDELDKKYKILLSQNESSIKQGRLEIQNEYETKIKQMEAELNASEANHNLEIELLKAKMNQEKNIELNSQKEKFDNDIKEKDTIINNLQRAKASMNVKQTGEDLESWCDNEVTSYMQNGLFNCTWIKDNKVVKDDDESKGSKADYIFKIYADSKHESDELLAAICLDMKDENPDSVNKKSNSDYYKQLDKNREKKECKYSVLVSNLEMDKPNVLPIFKVREYENMYVVRPAYLMVFLNMITSLTTRFSDIILSKEEEMIEIKSKVNLIADFEDIKKTYLDKPLESLEKSIETIYNNSESIKKACRNIDEQCDKINKNYISQINDKISKFDIKLTKIGKKMK